MAALTPASADLARERLAVELRCNPRPDLDALAEALPVAATDADHRDYRWLEGLAHLARGNAETALVALADAPADHLAAQTLRLQLFQGAGRSTEALPVARNLVHRFDRQEIPRQRALLAWACGEQGDVDCAVRQALRAAQSGEPAATEQLRRLLEAGSVPERLGPLVRAALGR